MSAVRVRFAPSPTGHLHVGGARTALFNWLFCRGVNGRFVIRIEDTDLLRNIEGADAKLLDDLRWLGLDWDEGPDVGGDYGPYRQSERRRLYDTARDDLLSSGRAYYAFDTPEELDALRRAAAAGKRSFRYPRPDPLPTHDDAEKARGAGRPVVVRLKTPYEPVVIRDEVLGAVTFPAEQIDDFVIVKANGWPTYHLAVVVDDAAMRISHVLRAQEHLMNTPRHVLLQRALGYPVPKFAHLPLVFNIDGTKMSKRDKHKAVRKAARGLSEAEGASRSELARIASATASAIDHWLDDKADTALDAEQLARIAQAAHVTVPEIDVHDFRASGYLPEALANFIALIGWSPGDDREKLNLDELRGAFSLDRINKTAGRFDREKLLAMNTAWAADSTSDRLLAAFRDYARVSGSPMESLDDDTLSRVLEACRGFRTFADVEGKAGVLFEPDERVRYDPTSIRKVLDRGEGRGWSTLEKILPELESLTSWNARDLEALAADFCARHELKLGDLAQPVRVAVAGRAVSPAIYDTLVLLGKEKTLARIRNCLDRRAAEG